MNIFSSPHPLSILALRLLILLFFCFLHLSGGKSTITPGSDGDFGCERDTGEILDPLLLLYVLCGQLFWKGIY